jgi:DNA-binding NarL/FixJ family response regulator
MKEHIKVLIVDDHNLFREMLYHTLMNEPDIKVVGSAVDGLEALTKVRELQPDVVLLDIDMPRLNGIDATEIIRKEFPEIKIVILTAYEEEEYIFKLIKSGASGYLLKDTSLEEVVRAIRSAYSGESLIQPRVVNKILKEFVRLMDNHSNTETKADDVSEILTDREKEVMQKVAQGLNNKEITQALFISESTVKTHISNIMHKLHLRDRVEIVLYAIQHNLA